MRKLLLADASPMMRRVIELTFANEGMEVLTARDGEHAVALISAERPDIVLADHALPGRSGYDVTSFVKSHLELARIPVILLSGAFEPADKVRAAQVGCDAILVKPFEPRQAIARVRELLEAARARAVERAFRHEPVDGGVDDPFGALHEALGQLGGGGHGNFGPGRTATAGLEETLAADESTVPTVDALLGTTFAAAADNPEAIAAESAATIGSPAAADCSGTPAARDPSRAPAHVEELMDEVTRRVLERLAPGTIHPVVTRMVGEIAERLLREELDRIRTR